MVNTVKSSAAQWSVMAISIATLAAACGAAPSLEAVDVLITGGRVMDPDSGLDTVRAVARSWR